jgi:hypothetical protein
LQKIDEDFLSPADEHVVAELKRLMLLRLAELESTTIETPKSIDLQTDGIESGPVVWGRMRSER